MHEVQSRMWIVFALFGIVGIQRSFGERSNDTPTSDTLRAARDRIRRLPGAQRHLPFRQYSGFLRGQGTRNLHYWLVESESNVRDDPLVIWFNGGPGCSSLTGLLEENGPFTVAEDGRTLVSNPDRWNKVASMLYIESPAGTGFSFSTDANYTTNDLDARDNKYAAIVRFFRRFPRFSQSDLYIFGQSYGGVYVPMLADLLNNNSRINLKGIAVGNGLVDSKFVLESLPFFEWSHGLFTDSVWQEMQRDCCSHTEFGDVESKLCDFSSCQGGIYLNEAVDAAFAQGFNPYDVNAPCDSGIDGQKYNEDSPLSERALSMGYPCMNSTAAIVYLNSPQVRHALHIPDHLPGIDEWRMCGSISQYTYSIHDIKMAPNVQRVLDSGKKVMLYYGTSDIICNFLGGRWFVESLGREVKTEERNWFYEDGHDLRQIGGSVAHYDHLDYVTIRGGSHMVPKSSSKQAFEMFQRFLSGWPSDQ